MKHSVILICLLSLIPYSALLADGAWEIATNYALEALEKSPDLKAAEQDVYAASAQRRETFGGLLPNINFNSRYSRADGGREIRFDVNDFLPASIVPQDLPPTVIPFLRETEQETRVELVQPLFNAPLYYSFRTQIHNEDASFAQFAAQQNATIANVRIAYFNAAQARELVTVAEADLASTERQLHDVKALHENNAAPMSDVQRATAARASAYATLTRARSDQQLAVRELNRLCGNALTRSIVWPDSLQPETLDTLSMPQAVKQAYANREELKRLENAIKAMRTTEKTTLSQYLPTVAAAAEYGYQGEEYTFDQDSDYFIVSGVLSWNLFSGFQRSAQHQQAVSGRRKLERLHEAAQAAIEQDVTAAYLTWKSNQDQLDAAREAHAAAEEGLRMLEAMYKEGMASQTDVVNARTQRTQAAASEIAARYGIQIARADLWRSMGISLNTTENNE